jgi:hypothetical protein
MLPHSWTEEVYVTSITPSSPVADCLVFEEWEQINGGKILHHTFTSTLHICIFILVYVLLMRILQGGGICRISRAW